MLDLPPDINFSDATPEQMDQAIEWALAVLESLDLDVKMESTTTDPGKIISEWLSRNNLNSFATIALTSVIARKMLKEANLPPKDPEWEDALANCALQGFILGVHWERNRHG